MVNTVHVLRNTLNLLDSGSPTQFGDWLIVCHKITKVAELRYKPCPPAGMLREGEVRNSWGTPGLLPEYFSDAAVKMLPDVTIGDIATQIFYKWGTDYPGTAFYFFTSLQDKYWKDFGRKKH